MDDYMSEKEQVEALRQWWKENGRYVIAGLVVGVGGVTGWQQWQAHQDQVAQSASDSYVAVMDAVEAGDAEGAAGLAVSLRESFPRSPYPAQAALMTARAWVDAGQLERAADDLSWAVANANDTELEMVARMRLARVQIALGRIADAETTVTVEDTGAFAPLFAELRGDAAYARGDVEAARVAYQEAVDGMGDGIGDTQSVQMKLDDVTMVSASAAPAMDTEAPVVDEAAEAVEDAADEAEADAGTEG